MEKKIQKINRMTNDQIKSKMLSLEEGQSHTYTNKEGNEVTKKGSPQTTSKYYIHLKEELTRRLTKTIDAFGA